MCNMCVHAFYYGRASGIALRLNILEALRHILVLLVVVIWE